MKFTTTVKLFQNQLLAIAGAAERKSNMDVLTHVLIQAQQGRLTLTGTNLTLTLVATRPESIDVPGSISTPVKKLMEICKALPPMNSITLESKDGKLIVKSGRSRFSLSSLPGNEYPSPDEAKTSISCTVQQKELHRALSRIAHAMAVEDVRYYLKGCLMHLEKGKLKVVATDGHRMALSSAPAQTDQGSIQCIAPGPTINVLLGLLTTSDKEITLHLGATHIQVELPYGEDGSLTFTTCTVDGKYPDYLRVIPRNPSKIVLFNREDLTQATTRVSLLSNEKFQGIRVQLTPDLIRLEANNPNQDEANEDVTVEYGGTPMEFGVNANYLLDILKQITATQGHMHLIDASSSVMITDPNDESCIFITMPMRI